MVSGDRRWCGRLGGASAWSRRRAASTAASCARSQRRLERLADAAPARRGRLVHDEVAADDAADRGRCGPSGRGWCRPGRRPVGARRRPGRRRRGRRRGGERAPRAALGRSACGLGARGRLPRARPVVRRRRPRRRGQETSRAHGDVPRCHGVRVMQTLAPVRPRRRTEAKAGRMQVRALQRTCKPERGLANQSRSRKCSRPTVRPGWSAIARSPVSTPGVNETRSSESWRMVSVSPDAAEDHLLVGDQAADPQAVHADAVDVRAAGARRARSRSRRAPGRARPRGGRPRSAPPYAGRCRRARRPCRGGAARRPRRTRRTARPPAAKRIIRTAPIEKLGAISTPVPGDVGQPAAQRLEPARRRSRWCRPRRGCRGRCRTRRLSITTSGWVKSTTASAPASTSVGDVVVDVDPRPPARGRPRPRPRDTPRCRPCPARPARRP